MPYIQDFCRSGLSFEERIPPDAYSTAMGRIALNFSALDEHLTHGIHRLLELDQETGELTTRALTFQHKVQLMADLIRKLAPTRQFNTGTDDLFELLDELVARCLKAEELRRKVLHYSWRPCLCESKAGSQEDRGEAYLLDVADFICEVAFHVEEFFLV